MALSSIQTEVYKYACDEFRKVIAENKIRQSMSRKANCWDNVMAESFF